MTILLTLAGIASAVSSARADDPPSLASIATRAHGISMTDAGPTGFGPGYRVEFGTDRVTFTPALGRAADRLWPLGFRLESVRRGAQTLYVADGSADRTTEGHLVRYRHDRGDIAMVERYEVTVAGVEQSFRFDRLPPGSGDLVVTGRIETGLTAAASDQDDGLTFLAPDVGGVSFGGVTGIEAGDGRDRGALRLDGDRLELVLPARFVDRAALPLVLDPLIGAITTVEDGHGRSPDIAYDATHDRYLVVWQDWFTFGFNDLRAAAIEADGTITSAHIVAGGVVLDPRVASVNGRDQVVICWQEGESMFGPYQVECRTLDTGTLYVVGGTDLGGTFGSELTPDVGGDDSPSSDSALVVWDDEALGIRWAKLTLPADGNPVVSGASHTVGENDNPAISSHPGASGRYLMVYERTSPVTQSKDIMAMALSRNGSILASVVVAASIDRDETAPAVDGDGDQWCVAYQRPETPTSADHDVFCRSVTFDAGLGQLVLGPERAVEAEPGDDEIEPSVAWLGSKYVVAWSDRDVGTLLDYSLSLLELAPDCTDCGFETTVFHGQRNIRSQIASERSGGGTSDRGMIVFESARHFPPFFSDALAMEVEAIGPGGAVSVIGGGCGVSGTISTTGAAALGNADFSLAFNGGDPTVPTALLNLNVASSPIPCAGCQITPILFLVTTPMVSGQVLVPLPIPCDPSLHDLTIETQLIMQNTSATPCYQAGLGVSFSDRLRFTIGL